jgi:hypothetical protein
MFSSSGDWLATSDVRPRRDIPARNLWPLKQDEPSMLTRENWVQSVQSVLLHSDFYEIKSVISSLIVLCYILRADTIGVFNFSEKPWKCFMRMRTQIIPQIKEETCYFNWPVTMPAGTTCNLFERTPCLRTNFCCLMCLYILFINVVYCTSFLLPEWLTALCVTLS